MPGRKVSEETRREEILQAAYDVAARRGIEALTLRAVAQRAGVSHGTILFHFRRRHELVAALLDRVLYATTDLRVPDAVSSVTRPSEQLLLLLRTEMERLSSEPRHFRLFLEYWALGVRNLGIRRKLVAALAAYRSAFRVIAEPVVESARERPPRARRSSSKAGASAKASASADGIAAVAVSLVHGCALQAVIDPKGFDVRQHMNTAVRMVEYFASGPHSKG